MSLSTQSERARSFPESAEHRSPSAPRPSSPHRWGSWLRVRPSPRYVIHVSLQGHIYPIRSIDRWSIVPHSHWSAGELHAHMWTCELAHRGRPSEVRVTAALCKLSWCRFLWLFLAIFSIITSVMETHKRLETQLSKRRWNNNWW